MKKVYFLFMIACVFGALIGCASDTDNRIAELVEEAERLSGTTMDASTKELTIDAGELYSMIHTSFKDVDHLSVRRNSNYVISFTCKNI